MDYLESRLYQPGDDVRNMDWRVTARSGKAHIKLYQEERERPVVLVVDLGTSMFFGTRRALKSVVAARAAALIGWASVLNGDRVGALLFNGTHTELPPTGGRKGAIRLIRHLVQSTDPEKGLAAGATTAGLNAALEKLRRVARPGSLVVVLSDFYGVDEQTRGHLVQLRRHCDLLLCQVLDPAELGPLPAGSYGISNGMSRGEMDLHSRARRDRYQDYFQSRRQQITDLSHSLAIPLVLLRTDGDITRGLRRGFLAGGISESAFGEQAA
jgi:uncharacterized protein (DUF58 family)